MGPTEMRYGCVNLVTDMEPDCTFKCVSPSTCDQQRTLAGIRGSLVAMPRLAPTAHGLAASRRALQKDKKTGTAG